MIQETGRFIRHVLSVNQSRHRSRTPFSRSVNPTEILKCQYCPCTFKQKSGLAGHEYHCRRRLGKHGGSMEKKEGDQSCKRGSETGKG